MISPYSFSSSVQPIGNPMQLNVVLADNHQLFRSCLRALLLSHSDIRVVAEAADGHEAVRASEELSPDVVIMDIEMPRLNGIEATSRICSREPHPKVVALTMHSDPRTAGAMLDAGASGYLTKDVAAEELATALRVVSSGASYVSNRIRSALYQTPPVAPRLGSRRPAAPRRRVALSPRQRDVLSLLADGKSVKEIGWLLNISPKTAEVHRRQIMEKLGIFTIAELTRYAICEGLTTVDA